ncbi:Hypothetical predicted protein [Lecanosticta acicola]|uniref:Zn(2)-C6 fungal-type domain-containing protein n=1 Tax=Lecanosticta acicola TaxID=111012 RepID=A0AAI8YR82_9PEZI|nr:Hypothetical predicted protein [Lecanosticta acicola]
MSGARPLLAARSPSGDKDGAGGASLRGSNRPPGASSARPKRTLIESACSACRRRKSRNLRTDCHYEAEEGESRWSALRRRNQILEAERDHVRELMYLVQTRPEAEALEIFQRIRQTSYDDLFLLLRRLKDSTGDAAIAVAPHVPGLAHPVSGPEQRLPPIQTILDPKARSHQPPHLAHSQSLSSEDSRGSSVGNSAGMEIISIPVSHQQQQQHRQLLDTLEPSLRPQPGD